MNMKSGWYLCEMDGKKVRRVIRRVSRRGARIWNNKAYLWWEG